MLRILKKDLRIFGLLAAVFILPTIFVWFRVNRSGLFPIAVFVHLGLTFAVTCMTVLINEQDEDFQKGYCFLQVLPLRIREITIAKFLLPLIAVSFLGLVNRCVYVLLFHPGQEAMVLTDRVTLLLSLFFILVCAVILLGVYLLGYMTFIRTISWTVTGCIILGLLAFRLFGQRMVDTVDSANRFQEWLLKGNHLPVLLGGLILYILMGFLANGIEKR